MQIEYQLEREDWIAYGEFALAHLPAHRHEIRRAQLLVLGAVLIVLILGWIWIASVPLLVVGAFVAAVAVMTVPHEARRSVRRQMRTTYATSKNPCLRGLHRLEARDDGLANSCESGSGLTRWEAIAACAETEKHVILVFGAGAGIAIPRDRIIGGDLGAFVSRVRRFLPQPGA